jgi:hypothetical protein
VIHAMENQIDDPVVGISNDFDTVGASPNYLATMTQNEYVGQPLVWGSDVRLRQFGDPNLPVNRIVEYFGASRRLFQEFSGTSIIYGGSMALTLDTYAAIRGWTGTNESPYGTSEPSRLVLNVWERSTDKTGLMANTTAAYQACARRLGGNALLTVSSRREICGITEAYADPGGMSVVLTTDTESPYRGLSVDELTQRATIQIPLADAGPLLEWFDSWHKKVSDPAGAIAALESVRRDLGLPPLISS